jgi:hypothetical protein
MCCSCGSQHIGRAPSVELARNFAEKRIELEDVCKVLNGTYARYERMKTRYDEIMDYWRQQKKRGYITPEEYQQLSELFVGAQNGRRKGDDTSDEGCREQPSNHSG